jgi:hypothetical protein
VTETQIEELFPCAVAEITTRLIVQSTVNLSVGPFAHNACGCTAGSYLSNIGLVCEPLFEFARVRPREASQGREEDLHCGPDEMRQFRHVNHVETISEHSLLLSCFELGSEKFQLISRITL